MTFKEEIDALDAEIAAANAELEADSKAKEAQRNAAKARMAARTVGFVTTIGGMTHLCRDYITYFAARAFYQLRGEIHEARLYAYPQWDIVAPAVVLAKAA